MNGYFRDSIDNFEVKQAERETECALHIFISITIKRFSLDAASDCTPEMKTTKKMIINFLLLNFNREITSVRRKKNGRRSRYRKSKLK